MEEVRDLLDLETAAKDIHIREDENGNTGYPREFVSIHVVANGWSFDAFLFFSNHGGNRASCRKCGRGDELLGYWCCWSPCW